LGAILEQTTNSSFFKLVCTSEWTWNVEVERRVVAKKPCTRQSASYYNSGVFKGGDCATPILCLIVNLIFALFLKASFRDSTVKSVSHAC